MDILTFDTIEQAADFVTAHYAYERATVVAQIEFYGSIRCTVAVTVAVRVQP